jgi:hypothetical protein
MNCLYAMLVIKINKFLPVDASMRKVYFSLHVQNPSCTCPYKLQDVFFYLRIRTKNYIRFSNFVKQHTSHKVSISLLYMAVHQEDLVAVAPNSCIHPGCVL